MDGPAHNHRGAMTTGPKLTIGIPTHNRPDRLETSLQYAMGQSTPVRVIVCDNSEDDETERACRAWSDNPNFAYYRSPEKALWPNWRWTAERAIEEGAELFQWHQDDDLLRVYTARRIVDGFAEFPQAVAWTSRLVMSYDNMLGCAWVGNWGPKIPMDYLRGRQTTYPGRLLLPVAYFDSWAMAPAKAFRVCDAFKSMLRDIPDGCDMFTERLDIAYMGLHGPVIADPALAGYWVIHGGNESQNTAETCEAQVRTAFRYLDGLMDGCPGWRDELFSWMTCLGTPDLLKSLHRNVIDHVDKSPYCAQIADIFGDVLRRSGVPESELRPTPRPEPAVEPVEEVADVVADAAA